MNNLKRLKDINIGYLVLENKETGFIEEGEHPLLGERYFNYKLERPILTPKDKCVITKFSFVYKPESEFDFISFLDSVVSREQQINWIGYTVQKHLSNHYWYKVTLIHYSEYETNIFLTNKFYEKDEKLGV